MYLVEEESDLDVYPNNSILMADDGDDTWLVARARAIVDWAKIASLSRDSGTEVPSALYEGRGSEDLAKMAGMISRIIAEYSQALLPDSLENKDKSTVYEYTSNTASIILHLSMAVADILGGTK